MHIRVLGLLCSLCVSHAGMAQGGEVFNSREHRCAALQQHAQREGRVTLKIALGTLTVFGSPAACDAETHFVTQPVWRTVDERFCIVGSVCSRRLLRLSD